MSPSMHIFSHTLKDYIPLYSGKYMPHVMDGFKTRLDLSQTNRTKLVLFSHVTEVDGSEQATLRNRKFTRVYTPLHPWKNPVSDFNSEIPPTNAVSETHEPSNIG